jgi:hypothetical protein
MADKTDASHAADTAKDSKTTAQKAADLEHPQPAVHSDNEKSKMPERDDEGRNQSPADHPGKQPGEGEPSAS